MANPWTQESLCRAIKLDPDFNEKCPSLAADIVDQRIKLVKLVEYLKDFLTDKEPLQRSQGIQVLSSVLRELPAEFLQEDEVRFIALFFCDRLKDHHDVIPAALKGILAIVRMNNLSKDLPSQILTTLMLNINCQSQRQEDRLIIYRILDSLIIPHLDSLKNLGPDLVYHIITAIDGERDPRNLKLIFSMLPVILRGLPLGHLTEDFFEVIACYFPVDFKPAAADPNQVTREDLALSLAECLTSVPSFSEFCIPLLLEKLDSSLKLAKLDSLYLLIKSCQTFPARDIAVHLSPIWMSLSRESLSNSDSEVREAARDAVTHLLRCLADMPVVSGRHSDPLKQLLNDVIAASATAISEVHTSLFLPSSELLLAAAKSCPAACENILMKITLLLCENFNEKQDDADKAVFLHTITKFLVVCKAVGVNRQNNPDISSVWNNLVALYLNASENKASIIRKEAVLGLTILIPTLNLQEREQLFHLISLAVENENAQDVRDQIKFCLSEIGTSNAAEVMSSILYKTLNPADLWSHHQGFEYRLEALCCLAALKPFSVELLPKVIDLIILSKDSHQIHVSLSSLRRLLESCEGGTDHVYECLHKNCNIVQILLEWWISGSENKETCDWVNNQQILEETCNILGAVTRNLNQADQASIVLFTVRKFFPESGKFKPFDISSPKHHLMTISLLEAVVASIYCDVTIPQIHQLCCSVAKLAISCSHPSVAVSACRLCASLINKVPDVRLLEAMLADISSMQELALTQNLESDATQAASLYGWIVKGLAMRGYGSLELWIDKLVNILRDNRRLIALNAAQAFRIIMEESPLYLNRQSHCTIRLLYRQRVFVGALKLVKISRTATVGDRIAYLLALSHLLSGVPQSVLANYFGEVLPVLLESLSQDSPVLQEAALGTLYGLLVQSVFSDQLKEHIQTMVPRLLCLVTCEHSMKIRRNALLCLQEISNLPVELLLPFKEEVVLKLEVCLDDPKRLVRKDAVKARTQWIMIGAPGNSR